MGSTPAFLVCFLSGVPALIYQVVWQRSLSLYFGVDIHATTVSVAVFMFGLGLGSLVGGKASDLLRRPAIAYAVVELLIAALGVTSIYAFPEVGERVAGSRLPIVILVDSCLLLVPTFLMGTTLPLMSRVVVDSGLAIGPRLAWLYGLNTLGAALGALLTTYLIIGLLGLHGATWVAATTNLLLGLTVLVAGARHRRHSKGGSKVAATRIEDRSFSGTTGPLGRFDLLLLSFLSGFVALGYEIVYYRLVGILLHGTVYVFGTLLFVYLSGIAVGALVSRRWNHRPGGVRRFAWAHVGIATYTLAFAVLVGHFSWLPVLQHLMAASFFTDFHPSLDLASGEFTLAALYSVVDAFLWPMLLAFPPALLMGIGFPSLIREGTDTVAILGQSVGRVLFANIIGSALGSLFVGFVMLHSFGTERTLQVLVLTGLAMSFLIFVRAGEPEPGVYGPGAATATVSVVALLCLAFFPAPLKLIAACHLADHPDVRLTVVEDRSGTAALRAQTGIVAFEAERAILGQTRLHIDGALHGLLGDEAQADLAVKLAISAHPGPRRILSIGLGDGRMVAAAAAVPAVREVVVVELKESLRRLIGSTPQGARIEQSGSRLRFVADDGRRWLQANPEERFDLIIMWPLHAAHARSGNLFSQEFFRLLRSRITSDGIVFFRSADPYSTARTAATVFDSVIRLGFQGYFASMHRLRFDPERAGVDPESLTDNLSADRETIPRFTEGSPLNSDFRPNGEYYLTYPQARWMRGGAIPYATGSGALAVYVSDRRR